MVRATYALRRAAGSSPAGSERGSRRSGRMASFVLDGERAEGALDPLAQARGRVRAFVLWYAADNPLSSRFWPRMGFRDLITRYELRYDPTAGRAAESATTGGTESDP